MNANVKEISGNLMGKGLKIGIAVSRFNDFFTKELVGGAVDCLVRHGVADKDVTVVCGCRAPTNFPLRSGK